jgi:hypothetical protein
VIAQPSTTRCDFTDLIVTQCAHCLSRALDSLTANGHVATAPEPKDAQDRGKAPPDAREAPSPRGRRRTGTVHVCLSCGGSITGDQAEERVPGRGSHKGSARYRHTLPEDCQAALRRPPGGNLALIGRYRELPDLRVVTARHRRR